MLLANGKGRCDLCGSEQENAGVTLMLVVSDLKPDEPTQVENLHFCRENGCNKKVRRKAVLKDYEERKGNEDE